MDGDKKSSLYDILFTLGGNYYSIHRKEKIRARQDTENGKFLQVLGKTKKK